MTVKNRLNLTRSAQLLFTTQPALSRGILDLEEELGVKLFVRHGKRLINITEEGKLFMQTAERILHEVDNIKRMSQEWRAEDQGRLIIATTHTQARFTLPNVLAKFRQQYPKVHIAIHQGTPSQNAQSLREGLADFAIATEGLHPNEDFLSLPLRTWQHLVIFPDNHPIQSSAKNADKMTLQTLVQHPLIMFDRAFAGRSRIDQAFQQAGLTPDVVIEASDADIIKTYVRSQMGVGILPNIAWDAASDQGLSALSVGHLFGENTTWLATLAGRYLRKFDYAFIEACNPQLTREKIERKT